MTKTTKERLVSLDVFRGATIAAMILVIPLSPDFTKRRSLGAELVVKAKGLCISYSFLLLLCVSWRLTTIRRAKKN